MVRAWVVGWCLLVGFAMAGETALTPKGESFPFPREAVIVYPADAASTEQFAAQMLADNLGRVNGGAYTLATDEADAPAPFVSVGETRQFKALGEPAPDLNVDGYAILRRDGNWYILGGTLSGPINGVTCLLEEDFGCRWYDSGELPAHPRNHNARVAPRQFVSPFRFRQPYYNSSAVHGEWNGWNRVNPFEGSFDKRYGKRVNYADQYFVHTFNKIIPAERYKDHPEYFPLIDGKRQIDDKAQRNLIEPGLSDEVARRLAELSGQQPDATIFSVSQQDDREGWSDDPETRAFIERENFSGLLVDFLNRVAEKAAATNPGLGVSTTAYQNTRTPPKTIRPLPNVYIMLCNDKASGSSYTVDETESFREELAGWQALGANIHIWDYVVHFGHYPFPQPNLVNMGRNIEIYRDHGVEGVLELGSYNAPSSSLEMLKSWVLAKKLWDPSRDTMALAADFVENYYGNAAPQMMRYLELQNEWRNRIRARGDEVRGKTLVMMLPIEFVREARPVLERALENVKDTPIFRRVEREWYCLLYLRAFHGPDGAGDRAACLADIEWLKDNQVRVGIPRIHEASSLLAYQRFERYARAKYAPDQAGPHSVMLSPECALGRPATVVDDPKAHTGQAIQLPKQCGGWSIQIPYSDTLLRFDADTEYVLRVRFRTEDVADKTPVPLFTVGHYAQFNHQDSKEVVVTAAPGDAYQTKAVAKVVVGPTPYGSGGMIHISGHGANPAGHVFFDTFELARADEYPGGPPADLPVFLFQ